MNFAGYHAEAGLGGLFGGTGTRGGLFAGVGTPFKAHASANLGGIVDGEDGGSTGSQFSIKKLNKKKLNLTKN